MKRSERQSLIGQLITAQSVGTQAELQALLLAEGVEVTQATLSRDLREMGLVRANDGSGQRRYTLSGQLAQPFPAAEDLVKSVARAQFMLVLKTDLGHADVLANVIDGAKRPDILGTVAGADTLLVICQDEAVAMAYEQALKVK